MFSSQPPVKSLGSNGSGSLPQNMTCSRSTSMVRLMRELGDPVLIIQIDGPLQSQLTDKKGQRGSRTGSLIGAVNFLTALWLGKSQFVSVRLCSHGLSLHTYATGFSESYYYYYCFL